MLGLLGLFKSAPELAPSSQDTRVLSGQAILIICINLSSPQIFDIWVFHVVSDDFMSCMCLQPHQERGLQVPHIFVPLFIPYRTGFPSKASMDVCIAMHFQKSCMP